MKHVRQTADIVALPGQTLIQLNIRQYNQPAFTGDFIVANAEMAGF
jgi:hypothetical protein